MKYLLKVLTLICLGLTFGVFSVRGEVADSATIANLKPSRTLPIVYISTDDGMPIVSKTDYVNGKIYIVDPTSPDSAILASAIDPAALEIRGRGNSTWTDFAKKPFKLKLAQKASVFGMSKSKHFVLLAHAPTQSYFHETVSFELARLIGLGWVPGFKPVEVVLNGEYQGVYAFGENIRIDDGRLEIAEQPDENTDPATIADGWLVEIDNTVDEPQILIRQTFDPADSTSWRKRFTIKTPEALSDLQREWITSELTTITRAIYNPDTTSTEWMEHLDLTSLARYYIIQELTCNEDAYVGSTYIYRDKGSDKWVSGPIWDSGYTFAATGKRSRTFIEQRKAETGVYGSHAWIEELWKFPAFREAVLKEWEDFYPTKMEPIYQYIEDFYETTKTAYSVNGQRWPQYNGLIISTVWYNMRRQMPDYAAWFDNYIREATNAIEDVTIPTLGRLSAIVDGRAIRITSPSGDTSGVMLHDISGRRMPLGRSGSDMTSQPLPSGIYIVSAPGYESLKIVI